MSKMDQNGILKPGDSIKPLIEISEVEKLAEELYGFKCSEIVELNAYDDKNFKIIVKESENLFLPNIRKDGYVFKVVNSMDSKKVESIEAQNSLLLFLISKGLCVPKPIQNTKGNYYYLKTLKSGNHMIRLFEFISGEILDAVPATKQLLINLGLYVATFNKTLKNFNHPAFENCQNLWMLENVPEVTKFLFAIHDTSRRQMIEEILDEFRRRVLPIKNNLEMGIIHGDFNQHNIVVEQIDDEWRVKGILDFTDSHWGCLLFELAIAVTYAMIFAKSIDAGTLVIAGYSKIRQIPEEELALLKICICGRLTQSLVLGAYSHLKDENNPYVLATAEEGWKILLKLWVEPEVELISTWRDHIINNEL